MGIILGVLIVILQLRIMKLIYEIKDELEDRKRF